MSALGNVYFTKARLEELVKLADKGLALSFSINDETNQYGQNVSFTISQTKDQREAKEKKVYVGNGSIVWTDGKIKVADKVEKPKEDNIVENQKEDNTDAFGTDEEDLPF